VICSTKYIPQSVGFYGSIGVDDFSEFDDIDLPKTKKAKTAKSIPKKPKAQKPKLTTPEPSVAKFDDFDEMV